MKIKLFLSALALMLSISSAYASFPVQRTTVPATTEQTVTDSELTETVELTTPLARAAQQSQGIALILWFFLGGLAAHRWYLKSPVGWNILFILTLGGIGIWAIIDLIDIFTENYPNANFKNKFF
ncbi:TM2 domain-containing protein [Winogradskyella alexanderae]|uniref:TM2 domain-containing protein n=1 Tax=Winogradskyella alexanderae TaxID=2877123 RepID=A0ABS7XNU0_9FLAO|nr:TM2 domain-containing protein [Winogradskyella alexanderae]MCA0131656.1 TM2 domain-containing protein [Winogradskyella alexanderae]